MTSSAFEEKFSGENLRNGILQQLMLICNVCLVDFRVKIQKNNKPLAASGHFRRRPLARTSQDTPLPS